jgi:putative FmdB family regulatory protein
MPIYEYECKACGPFEVMQKITEKPLKKCEKCGGPVHKLVSLSSFALVGGGWYKDLYASTSHPSDAAKDKYAESKASRLEKKADSKPDSKADSKPDPKPKAESKPATPAAA